MSIAVRDFRLTLIWVETALTLLEEPAPEAPHAFLGRPGAYSARFLRVRQLGRDETGLMHPWPFSQGNRFWTYYFQGAPPGTVDPRQAWRQLVPFRLQVPAALHAAWLPGRVTAEAFLYPHGHALVVTTRIAATARPPFPLDTLVDLAHDTHTRGEFTVTWSSGEQVTQSIAEFAEAGLSWLRRTGLGTGAPRGTVTSTPFSIATFVKMEGIDPAAQTPDQGEVHRALEALTSRRHQTWKLDVLPSLATSTGDSRRGPPSHLLYVRRRGCVIWYPAAATNTDPALRSLGCYHRNQVFAALQVESIGGLVRAITAKLGGGEALGTVEENCARLAGGVLGRMYGGDPATYRSGSCRAHIDLNGLVADTNVVRARYQMPSLS